MTPLTTLVSSAAAVAGETLIEKIIVDLYELAKQVAGARVKLWYVKKCVRKLHTHVHKLRQVKTLWQVDKAVDIKQFYCDSRVVIAEKRTLVRSVSDFGDRKRVLITGIAGQGKSILLRYLCSNALMAGIYLPVFIELRRIASGETVLAHVRQFLEIVGIPDLQDEILKSLLSSGKIMLFLDGFDEVAEPNKPRIVHEIEHLAMAHDNMRMIVTSRPDSGLEVSPTLEVIKLSDLSNGEYKSVIRKLSDDSVFADNLIKQVESHRSKLQELLCTPLLVTLLVMSYKSFQELPEQLSEFYDSIFQVLLQRHDGAKPGFKRPRRCLFNDNQYRSMFECLCFESKRKTKSIFDYDDVSSFAQSALRKNHLTADADKYIEDIVKVTCLILKEGKDYRFIHKSVQEYYAAAFIKHRSEPVAERFYEQMVRQGPYGAWRQELHFLSEIDRYRFNKYFYLPYLCWIIGCAPSSIPEVEPPVDTMSMRRLLGPIKLGFAKRQSCALSIAFFQWNALISSANNDQIFQLRLDEVAKAIEQKKIGTELFPSEGMPGYAPDPFIVVTMDSVIEKGLLSAQTTLLTQSIIHDAYINARKTHDAIVKEESIDITLSFDAE